MHCFYLASVQCKYCHLGVCVDIHGSFVLFSCFGGPAVVISNILNSVLPNSIWYTLDDMTKKAWGYLAGRGSVQNFPSAKFMNGPLNLKPFPIFSMIFSYLSVEIAEQKGPMWGKCNAVRKNVLRCILFNQERDRLEKFSYVKKARNRVFQPYVMFEDCSLPLSCIFHFFVLPC